MGFGEDCPGLCFYVSSVVLFLFKKKSKSHCRSARKAGAGVVLVRGGHYD